MEFYKMEAPILTYNPNVEEFAGRSFTIKDSLNNTEKTLTFKEAFTDRRLRKKALSFYSNPPSNSLEIPLEFTQYVLRSLAIAERGCIHFEKKLCGDVRKCLKDIIGRTESDIEIKRVHSASTNNTNRFQGLFVKNFFRKVIYNLRNEVGRYEYSENFATIFPFQVLDCVPVEYVIEVESLLDDGFYTQIQSFLDDHFESADARQVGPLYLANIHHFRATQLSEKALFEKVLSKPRNAEDSSKNDYFCSFPRLSEKGITWFQSLYLHYKNVRKVFDNVEVSTDIYNRKYFKTLPESNFVDLYELLDTSFYKFSREKYIERFEKYLFFFVHALKEQPNPVFFIDDVLFECLKSLRRFKISREDFSLASDIAKLSLVDSRTKFRADPSNNHKDSYFIEFEFLQGIKEYVLNIPNIETAQIDVGYRTDYLHGWMLLRNNDTCYEICYSKKQRRHKYFIDRILCSVLPPDAEQIKKVVIYNSYSGEESRLSMPKDIQTIRNFIRLSNKYDFGKYTLTESNDEFLTRDVEAYFDHLTITEYSPRVLLL